jgi:hypothetical protein
MFISSKAAILCIEVRLENYSMGRWEKKKNKTLKKKKKKKKNKKSKKHKLSFSKKIIT